MIHIEEENLITFIQQTQKSLLCPRERLKTMDHEDKQAIRDEENGYAVLADTLIYKIIKGELSDQTQPTA